MKPKVEQNVDETKTNSEDRVHAQEVKHDAKNPGNPRLEDRDENEEETCSQSGHPARRIPRVAYRRRFEHGLLSAALPLPDLTRKGVNDGDNIARVRAAAESDGDIRVCGFLMVVWKPLDAGHGVALIKAAVLVVATAVKDVAGTQVKRIC